MTMRKTSDWWLGSILTRLLWEFFVLNSPWPYFCTDIPILSCLICDIKNRASFNETFYLIIKGRVKSIKEFTQCVHVSEREKKAWIIVIVRQESGIRVLKTAGTKKARKLELLWKPLIMPPHSLHQRDLAFQFASRQENECENFDLVVRALGSHQKRH